MHYRTAVLLVFAITGSAATLQAQVEQAWTAQTAHLSRSELQGLLDRLDEAANSPGYSLLMRQRASAEGEFVRARLAGGDFNVGDRISLDIEGQQQLRDTLTVAEGPIVTIPRIGDVSLKGVLRSELQQRLSTEVGQYIRGVTVHASVLVRLTVQGQVGRPGYFIVPANGSIEDAVMAAGGPTADADLEAMEIWRGDRVVLGGPELQQAITAGRTLNQLDLRAGDRIVVPARHARVLSWDVLRSVAFVLPSVIYLINAVGG